MLCQELRTMSNMTSDTKHLPSLVQEHQNLRKKERELNARKMLTVVSPKNGRLVRQLALKETDFDIDQAYELIFQFNGLYSNLLETLHFERNEYITYIRDGYLRRILSDNRERMVQNQN